MAGAFESTAFESTAFEVDGGGTQSVTLGLIDQTAVTFSPTVVSNQEIVLGLIDQTASPFSPSVANSTGLVLGLIDQSASTFDPTISATASILLALIDQAAAPFAPTVALAAQDVLLALIDRTAATFTPTITTTTNVSLALISQAASPFAPEVIIEQFVTVGRINRTAAPHAPVLAYDQALTFGRIERASQAFAPYLFEAGDPESPTYVGLPLIEMIAGATGGLGGSDFWSKVIIADATFTSQVNGTPGTCHFRIRDDDNDVDLVIGDELTLVLNGENVWRGFITNVTRGFAFDAEDRSVPAPRILIVDGVDLNILFRKRVVFNQADPRRDGPLYSSDNTDDTVVLDDLFTEWLDLSSDDLNTTTLIENVGTVNTDHPTSPIKPSDVWADTMRRIDALTNAIFYIDPDRNVVHTDVDTPNAALGLSDQPGVGEVGYRDMEILHDGTQLINDALVWGTGIGSDQLVIARDEDATSIAAHGVWQYGELNSSFYKQSSVNQRAASLVDGSPQSKRGAKNDKISVSCTVYADGFRPAQKVDFTSNVFGFNDVIPIRRIDYSFVSPTQLRYRLYLSHEIDLPWSFFDNYLYDFGRPRFPTVPDIEIPVFNPPSIEGGCTDAICGITDTFTRSLTGGWGVSDAGYLWDNDGDGVSVDGGGRMLTGSGDDYQTAYLPYTDGVSFDIRFDLTIVTEPTDQSAYVGFYSNNCSFDIERWDDGPRLRLTVPGVGSTVVNPFSITEGVAYSVHWVGQAGVSQSLRLWPAADPEPAAWDISINAAGQTIAMSTGFSTDLYNGGTAEAFETTIDNLDIAATTSVIVSAGDTFVDEFTRTVSNDWGTSVDGPWVMFYDSGSQSVGVDGDEGYLTSVPVSQPAPSVGGRITPSFIGDDVWEVDVKFRFDDGSAPSDTQMAISIGVDNGTVSGPELACSWATNSTGTEFGLGGYYASSDPDPLTTASITSNTLYRIKLRVDNGNLQAFAKLWLDGGAEPGWLMTADLDSIPTGNFQVAMQLWTPSGSGTGSRTLYIAEIKKTTFGGSYTGGTGVNRCLTTQFDDFNRSVTDGWGVASPSGVVWTATANASAFSVNGTMGRMTYATGTVPNITASGGPWGEDAWVMTYAFRTGSIGSVLHSVRHDFTGSDIDRSVWLHLATAANTGGLEMEAGVGGGFESINFAANTDYIWKMSWDRSTGDAGAKVWAASSPEPPDWQVTAVWGPGTDTFQTILIRAQFWNSASYTHSIDYIEFDYDGKPCYTGIVCAVEDWTTNQGTPLVMVDAPGSLGGSSATDWIVNVGSAANASLGGNLITQASLSPDTHTFTKRVNSSSGGLAQFQALEQIEEFNFYFSMTEPAAQQNSFVEVAFGVAWSGSPSGDITLTARCSYNSISGNYVSSLSMLSNGTTFSDSTTSNVLADGAVHVINLIVTPNFRQATLDSFTVLDTSESGTLLSATAYIELYVELDNKSGFNFGATPTFETLTAGLIEAPNSSFCIANGDPVPPDEESTGEPTGDYCEVVEPTGSTNYITRTSFQSGSAQVWMAGLRLRPGIDFTANGVEGLIETTFDPEGASLYICYYAVPV
jgi:hypothetical protein